MSHMSSASNPTSLFLLVFFFLSFVCLFVSVCLICLSASFVFEGKKKFRVRGEKGCLRNQLLFEFCLRGIRKCYDDHDDDDDNDDDYYRRRRRRCCCCCSSSS